MPSSESSDYQNPLDDISRSDQKLEDSITVDTGTVLGNIKNAELAPSENTSVLAAAEWGTPPIGMDPGELLARCSGPVAVFSCPDLEAGYQESARQMNGPQYKPATWDDFWQSWGDALDFFSGWRGCTPNEGSADRCALAAAGIFPWGRILEGLRGLAGLAKIGRVADGAAKETKKYLLGFDMMLMERLQRLGWKPS